jgi:hypothetical protein
MADMVALVVKKIQPILAHCKKEILENDHLQPDETPWAVVPEGGKGTKRGYLWGNRSVEEEPTTGELI